MHNPIVGSTWPISLLFSLVQELRPLWTTPDDYDGTSAASLNEITAHQIAQPGRQPNALSHTIASFHTLRNSTSWV